MQIINGDEIHDFYAHLGQAMYAIQYVEGTLHKVLAIKVHFSVNRPTSEEAGVILESCHKKTLGGLITTARNTGAVHNDRLMLWKN